MKEETSKIIEELLSELLHKASFEDFEIEPQKAASDDSQMYVFNIKTETDSRFLIGQHGDNLRALQYLTRLLARKKIQEDRIGFLIDVNNYCQQKNKSVVEMAREAAREAAKDKKAIFLRSMSPYERRLVHLELINDPQVVTESVGEGEDRKVVIKPAGLISSQEEKTA